MTGALPSAAERSAAIKAQSLYLVNLTLLPGIAFLALWRMHALAKDTRRGFAGQHLHQAFVASVWAGGLLVVAVAALAMLGDLQRPGTWIAIVVYVICVHSMLVLAGVIALSRAMAGQSWRYPLIGPG